MRPHATTSHTPARAASKIRGGEGNERGNNEVGAIADAATRARLLRNVDDPSQFIQVLEYRVPEMLEMNRRAIAGDALIQGALRTWRAARSISAHNSRKVSRTSPSTMPSRSPNSSRARWTTAGIVSGT